MKIYTIIGGVNGAGKNSLTGVLKAETNDLGTVIDVNKLAASLGGSNLKAGKAAVQKIGRLLEQGGVLYTGNHPCRAKDRADDP